MTYVELVKGRWGVRHNGEIVAVFGRDTPGLAGERSFNRAFALARKLENWA